MLNKFTRSMIMIISRKSCEYHWYEFSEFRQQWFAVIFHTGSVWNGNPICPNGRKADFKCLSVIQWGVVKGHHLWSLFIPSYSHWMHSGACCMQRKSVSKWLTVSNAKENCIVGIGNLWILDYAHSVYSRHSSVAMHAYWDYELY